MINEKVQQEVSPMILVKRSVSPDGKIDSMSFEFSHRITDLATVSDSLLDVAVALDLAARKWREEQLESSPSTNSVNGSPSEPGKNGKQQLEAAVTTIRWVDHVESKFHDNGQWRIRFEDGNVPPMYLDDQKLTELVETFGLSRPFQLSGKSVRAFVDAEKKKTRRIELA